MLSPLELLTVLLGLGVEGGSGTTKVSISPLEILVEAKKFVLGSV